MILSEKDDESCQYGDEDEFLTVFGNPIWTNEKGPTRTLCVAIRAFHGKIHYFE
jgi:hypothetical protein